VNVLDLTTTTFTMLRQAPPHPSLSLLLAMLFLSWTQSVLAQPNWMLNLQSSTALNDVDFVDENVGFAGGYGVVLRTLDGGHSWTNIFPEYLFNSDQYAIRSFSADTVYTMGTPSATFRWTFDGGETWGTKVLEKDFGSVTWITAMDASRSGMAFAVGQLNHEPLILRSLNGSDWFKMNHGLYPGLFIDVHVVDDKTIWVVGVDNFLLKSDDGGLTWERRSSPVEDTGGEGGAVELTAIFFLDDGQAGWLATGLYTGAQRSASATIFRTTDGGESWVRMSTLGSLERYGIRGIHFFSEEIGWICYEHAIAFTVDGGATWQEVDLSEVPSNTTIRDLDFVDPDHGWAVGGLGTRSGPGTILQTLNGALLSASSEIPDDPGVLSVFPNPIVGGSARVILDVQSPQTVTIEVYDVTGRRVDTIMNGVINPGSNSLPWDSSRLGAGLYLVRVVGESQINSAKAVILN
jgi:photosystem II stability/assembly factor-like uncharacterized protein